MIIDTHAHLDYFENIDEVIERAKNVDVQKIIVPSADPDSFNRVIEISEKYDFIYSALGVHPLDIEKYQEDTIRLMADLISSHKKIIAIGEIGLDYHYSKDDKEKQKCIFKLQLELAESLNLPVLIHDRDAHKDTMDILENYKFKNLLMHCYSGSLELAKDCLKRGYYFGIGGVVTFKNAKVLKDVTEYLPLDRILLETDCPYLAPHPFRGEKNEPSYLPFIVNEIANIKNLPKEVIIEETTKNALKFFNIEE